MSDSSDIIAKGPGYCLRMGDVEIEAVRSSGPGGQNVNKVATKIVIHFNIPQAQGLTDYIKKRLFVLFANQITAFGDLVVVSSRFRSQHQNRTDALGKLAGKLRQAAHRPKRRVKTTISKAVHETRLKTKKRRSAIKKNRQRVNYEE